MSRFVYCLVYRLAALAYYSFNALDKVEGDQDSWMRRFLPLLIGVTVTLLAGCQSKRDICAKWSGGVMSPVEAQKALGVGDVVLPHYCEYYKK